MSEETGARSHNLAVNNRESGTFSGICEVLSFDEEGILLESVMGTLAIDGKGLRITRLDLGKGEVDVTGKINGIVWADKKARRSFGKKR